jgi:hypothetical protein
MQEIDRHEREDACETKHDNRRTVNSLGWMTKSVKTTMFQTTGKPEKKYLVRLHAHVGVVDGAGDDDDRRRPGRTSGSPIMPLW